MIDNPARTRSARNRLSAPSGLALFQRNGERRSGGSDSGRISQPYSALAKLKAAATQNGSRGAMPPGRPPIAGPRINPAPNPAPLLPNTAGRFSGGVTSAL